MCDNDCHCMDRKQKRKMITIYIEGDPVGKGRPRVTKTGVTFTPAKTRHYEEWVKACYYEALTKEGMTKDEAFIGKGIPIRMEILAFFPIPKSYSKKKKESILTHQERPTKKPDIDNIAKIICDSLNGLAYHDDNQIVDLEIGKEYTQKKEGYLIVSIMED